MGNSKEAGGRSNGGGGGNNSKQQSSSSSSSSGGSGISGGGSSGGNSHRHEHVDNGNNMEGGGSNNNNGGNAFLPKNFNFIRLIKKLANVTRDAGQNIRLECEAEGIPPPKEIKWYKNGVQNQWKGDRFKIKHTRKK